MCLAHGGATSNFRTERNAFTCTGLTAVASNTSVRIYNFTKLEEGAAGNVKNSKKKLKFDRDLKFCFFNKSVVSNFVLLFLIQHWTVTMIITGYGWKLFFVSIIITFVVLRREIKKTNRNNVTLYIYYILISEMSKYVF